MHVLPYLFYEALVTELRQAHCPRSADSPGTWLRSRQSWDMATQQAVLPVLVELTGCFRTGRQEGHVTAGEGESSEAVCGSRQLSEERPAEVSACEVTGCGVL